MVVFTKEELELIKEVMNVFHMIHKKYKNSDKADNISEDIWEKLDEAGVENIDKDLDFEDTLEGNLYDEDNDCEDGEVTFYHIGGYELLRDGTQEESFDDVEDLKEFLNDLEFVFDGDIEDIYELAESVEDAWAARYDDGGGSGWIK